MLIRINGGLGNQLFQYALGESIRFKTGKKVEYETFSYIRDTKRKLQLDQFDVERVGNTRKKSSLMWYLLARVCLLLGGKQRLESRLGILREKDNAQVDFDNLSQYRYLVGYWQCEKNFEEIRETLKKQFRCKKQFAKSDEIFGIIERTNAVAVHIRRGDYLQNNNQGIYAINGMDYYIKAMDLIKKKVEEPVFVVFSNDISWCKQNITAEQVYYIDEKYSESDINDFEIMRKCKHFVIGNSTFSWWAAWLADSRDKVVIAPEKWYVDDKMNEQIGKDILNNMIRV